MKKSTALLLSASILALFFVCLVAQIKDPDFFWHLKTGELICKNRSLPAADSFAYTSPLIQDGRVHFILTGFWLSQVLFYLVYALGGMPGIVVLRFLVMGILVYVMLLRRRGDFPLYLGLLLIFTAVIATSFPLERPQVFSFLLFAVLLLLLEKLRNNAGPDRRRWVSVVLPAIMLIWSNAHPGFVLGLAAIAVYILFEGIKYLKPSLMPMNTSAYGILVVAGVSGIAIAMLNPNGFHVFSELSPQAFNTAGNIEYYSTPRFFLMFRVYGIVLYWFLLLLACLGLILNFRRVDITEFVLLAGIGYFSFTSVRYLPLFMIAALPALSDFFSRGKFLTTARTIVIVIAIASCSVFTWNRRANIDSLSSGDWISGKLFPVRAAEFIERNDLQGNMFNPHFWGGYLIWKFAPERKVFIDGRDLYARIYNDYLLINSVETFGIMGKPAWKAMLDAYSVNYVITPLVQFQGGPEPLAIALMADNEWVLVFSDARSAVFIRNIPANSGIVKKFALPKYIF